MGAGTNWFRGALMRATWDSQRLWALVPVAGGDIPGQAVTKLQPSSLLGGRRLVCNIKVHNQTRSREMGSLTAELLDATHCVKTACTISLKASKRYHHCVADSSFANKYITVESGSNDL